MDLFISWSKPRGQALASALHAWIPKVIQAVKPWMSSADIEKGARWPTEIAQRLGKIDFGLVCLTPESVNESWLLFEAGALSKVMETARVYTVVLGLSPSDLTGPLGQFQATTMSRDDMRKLMADINLSQGEGRLSTEALTEAFDTWYPRLEETVASIPAHTPPANLMRPEREMLEEVLHTVRRLARERESEPQIPVHDLSMEQYDDFNDLVNEAVDRVLARRKLLRKGKMPGDEKG